MKHPGSFYCQCQLWFIIFVIPLTQSSECSPAGQCSCPTLYLGLPDVEGIAGRPLMFRLPTDAFAGHFTDLDINVQTSNGSVLGSWLSYNHTTRSFSSVIINETDMTLTVQVTVSCSVCDSNCAPISDTFSIKTRATKKAGQYLYIMRQLLLEVWQYLTQHGLEINNRISDNASNRLLFLHIHSLSNFKGSSRNGTQAFLTMHDIVTSLKYLCTKLQKQITFDAVNNNSIRDKKHEFARAKKHLCTPVLLKVHEFLLTLYDDAMHQRLLNTNVNIIYKIMKCLDCKYMYSHQPHRKEHFREKREASEIIDNSPTITSSAQVSPHSSLHLINSGSSPMFSDLLLDMFSDHTQVDLKHSESFTINNPEVMTIAFQSLFTETITPFAARSVYELSNTIRMDNAEDLSPTQPLISIPSYDEITPSYLTSFMADIKLESSDFQGNDFYTLSKTDFTQYVDVTEYTALYNPHSMMTTPTHLLSTDSNFETILSSPVTPSRLSMPSSAGQASVLIHIGASQELTLTPVLSTLIDPSLSVTESIETRLTPIVNSAWKDELQPSSVHISHAAASSSLLPELTTSDLNFPPWLFQALAPITVHVGQKFEFTIPKNTFKDKEDGDTTKLSLSVLLRGNKPLPSDLWLQFYAANQSMHGFPLSSDYTTEGMKLVLVAEDAQGLTRRDAFSMVFNQDLIHNPSHTFLFQINRKFVKFLAKRNFYLSLFAERVAVYFARYSVGALDSIKFGIVNASRSSVKGKGTVISVSVSECLYDDMESIYDSMVNRSTGEMSRQVLEHFHPEFTMIIVTYKRTDICLNTVLAARTTPSSTSANTHSEEQLWYKIFIPVVIFIIVCIIIILIIVLLRRRKSHDRSPIRKSDTFTFADQRNPMVLPGDIELHDVLYKPQRPAVLPSEKDHPPARNLGGHLPAITHTRPPPPSYPGDCMYNPSVSASLDDSFDSDTGPGVFVIGGNSNHPPAYRVPPPYMPNPGFTYDEY